MHRIIILIRPIDLILSLDGRSLESRDTSNRIISLVAISETLAASAWKIDDEIGHHETGDGAADGLFEMQNCGERGAEIFDTRDHVTLVDVVLFDLC